MKCGAIRGILGKDIAGEGLKGHVFHACMKKQSFEPLADTSRTEEGTGVVMQDFRMETFLTVCRNMNYTKAAEELCITQPAVSQHIRHLEEYYGTKLFISEGKKMRLTEAGKLLLSAGITMKHDEYYLKEKMAEAANSRTNLVFGATLTIGEYVLPRKLNRYLTRNPDTVTRVTVGNTQELLSKIDAGELDFAMVEGYFSRKDYDYKIFSTERFVAVAASGYPFAKEPEIIEDLCSLPLIVREPGSGTREVLERVLEGKNMSLSDFNMQMEINNIQVIKKMVAGGHGITFLYRAAVEQEIQNGTLKEIKLKDFDASHDFYFVWRKDSIYASHYEELFRDLAWDKTGDI